MALADWVVNKTGTEVIAHSIDVATPMIGDGSLNLSHSGPNGPGGLNMYLGAPFSKGFTKGRIRTLIRWDTGGTIQVGDTLVHSGVIFLQDQLDVSDTTGNFYTLGIGSAKTGGDFKIRIVKHNIGLNNIGETSRTEIFTKNTGGVHPPSADDFWPIEIEWVVDIPGLGGTRLIAREGTKNSLDFGTLIDIYDAVDVSSPLTTSVAEGVFSQGGTNFTNARTWTVDQTSIFELT